MAAIRRSSTFDGATSIRKTFIGQSLSGLLSFVVGRPKDNVVRNNDCTVTPDPDVWAAKVKEVLAAGKDDTFIVIDFDRTITKCFLETGERAADGHDILASVAKVSKGCKRMMEVLMDKYYPIETDPTLCFEEKSKHMEEWYSLCNELLGQQGITADDVEKAVESCAHFRLRPGVEELFQLAYCAGIPVVILSAGVGNVIEEVVRQRIRKPSGETGKAWENVRVLSNTLIWDDGGKFQRFSEPIMHPFNKSMKDAPQELHDFIKGRSTCILAGDGLGDLTMAHGLETSCVLTMGFLNERIDERLAKYTASDAFDRVVLNDCSFEPFLDVIRALCTVNPLVSSAPVGEGAFLTPNMDLWASKVAKLIDAGVDETFFIFDFDRTMTKCFLESGQRSMDCHEILASIPKVTWQCKRTMEVLMEKWYPIETDPNLSVERKSAEMVEWYSLVNALLVSQGITQQDVAEAVAQCKDFRLRAGVEEVFQFAYLKKIPIVILSAGLGNIIEEVVRQRIRKPNGETGLAWENVWIVSNTLLWNETGRHVGFSDPIIHPFNKTLQDAPSEVLEFIGDRQFGILAGDGLGDLTMAIGTHAAEVLKVGFLNERIDERLTKYTSEGAYDRVILRDGSFGTVVELLRELK